MILTAYITLSYHKWRNQRNSWWMFVLPPTRNVWWKFVLPLTWGTLWNFVKLIKMVMWVGQSKIATIEYWTVTVLKIDNWPEVDPSKLKYLIRQHMFIKQTYCYIKDYNICISYCFVSLGRQWSNLVNILILEFVPCLYSKTGKFIYLFKG